MEPLDIRAAVAFEIMGYTKINTLYRIPGYGAKDKLLTVEELPQFESDPTASETLVEKMLEEGWILKENRTHTSYECKWIMGKAYPGLCVGHIKSNDVYAVRAMAALEAIRKHS